MREDIPKKVIDITGVELTPGEPTVCLGNGDQGFECCCDECDYFLLCFPQFDPKNIVMNTDDRMKRTRNFNNSSSFLYQPLYASLSQISVTSGCKSKIDAGSAVVMPPFKSPLIASCFALPLAMIRIFFAEKIEPIPMVTA